MVQELSAMIQQATGASKEIHIADRPNIRNDAPATAGKEPNASQFNEIMKQPVQATTNLTPLPAPMQEASRLGGVLKVQEAKQLSAVLDRFKQSQESRWKEMINKVKSNQNLELSPTVSKHLEMKLDSLNQQMGRLQKDFNLPPAEANQTFAESLNVTTDELSKPVKTFFNFISNGERQLYNLEREISGAFATGSEAVSPAVMLKLQLKMTHVSQQLELFTSILNKGLESSKTVFNTQI